MAKTLGSKPRRRTTPSKPRVALHCGVRIWMEPTTGKWTLSSGNDFKTLKAAKAYINKGNACRNDLAQTTSALTGVAITLPLIGATTAIAAGI